MNNLHFTHIIELVSGMDMPDKLKLTDLKYFIRYHEDISLIDNLVQYNVPLTWEVLSHDSVNFLCIAIKKVVFIKLGNDIKYFEKGCAIPHLTTLLYNGIVQIPKGEAVPSSEFETDISLIIKNALASDDIYVIKGRSYDDKRAILKKIIHTLIREDETSYLTIKEYKEHLETRQNPVYDLSLQIENTLSDLNDSESTCQDTLAKLIQVYQLILTIAEHDLLNEFNTLTDELRIKTIMNQTAESELVTVKLKKKIIKLLQKIHTTVRSYEEQRFNKKNKALLHYSTHMTQGLLDKYVNKDYIAQPFTYKDITVIDMDICDDDDLIQDAVANAKKIIMAGSYMGGLYKSFLKAALVQQRKDHQNRIALCQAKNKQHPKLSAFINRNFYADLSLPEEENIYNKDNKPVFIWLTPQAMEKNAGEIQQLMKPDLKAGVIAFEKDKTKTTLTYLQSFDKEMPDIHTGTETELHGKEFDILFLIPGSGNEDMKRLYMTMVMVTQTLIIVGDHQKLESGSLLRKFFCLCMGDKIHGRVYD